MALAKKKIKPTPVTLRKPDEVNRTLEELKAGKVPSGTQAKLGEVGFPRVVLDFEAARQAFSA